MNPATRFLAFIAIAVALLIAVTLLLGGCDDHHVIVHCKDRTTINTQHPRHACDHHGGTT